MSGRLVPVLKARDRKRGAKRGALIGAGVGGTIGAGAGHGAMTLAESMSYRGYKIPRGERLRTYGALAGIGATALGAAGAGVGAGIGARKREVHKASPARTRRRRQERAAGTAPKAAPKPQQLVAGQAGRDLRALEHGRPDIAPKAPVEATPPPAAVNHATTPASAARRLTSSHMKIGGGIAAGVGAAGAGGYLLHRRAESRKKALVGVGKADPEVVARINRLAARRKAGFGFKTKTPQDAMPVAPKPATLVPTQRQVQNPRRSLLGSDQQTA